MFAFGTSLSYERWPSARYQILSFSFFLYASVQDQFEVASSPNKLLGSFRVLLLLVMMMVTRIGHQTTLVVTLVRASASPSASWRLHHRPQGKAVVRQVLQSTKRPGPPVFTFTTLAPSSIYQCQLEV